LTSESSSVALCARFASDFPSGALHILGQFAIEIFAAKQKTPTNLFKPVGEQA
jgi:hypothetical protein